MCVQQNHFKLSQSSRGVIGETISPTISIFPARRPRMSGGLSSGGTSLASGFPRLVISTGMRLVRTSSMTCRHRALNSPAAIVFIWSLRDNHGYFNIVGRRDENYRKSPLLPISRPDYCQLEAVLAVTSVVILQPQMRDQFL